MVVPRTRSLHKAARPAPPAVPVNAQLLQQALGWVIDSALFAPVQLHGNTRWRAADLVVLATLWVWSDHQTLTGAFAQARELATAMAGAAAVRSYQGLTGALATWTGALLPLL